MNDSDVQAGGARSSRSIVIAVLAALIPLIPIAGGLAISSSGAHTQTASSSDTQFDALAPSSAAATGAGSGQGGSSGASRAGASGSGSSQSTASGGGTRAHKRPSYIALVGLLRHATTMRRTPGGPSLGNVAKHTDFGSPTTLLVVRQAGDWLGVISAQSGNGRIGWVRRSAVSLNDVHWQLRVSLSARRLTVMENGRTLRRYSVAVGRPEAPTPTGRFAVTDRLQTHDPAGPYGCCILALSAHSPHAIQGWNGGNRIAIHSTPDAGSIGQAVSHGCVRVTLADGAWLLRHIPLGTPTIIRA